MDMNVFRGIVTGILILLFIGVWIWTYSKKRKAYYEDVAWMAVEDSNHEPKLKSNPNQSKEGDA